MSKDKGKGQDKDHKVAEDVAEDEFDKFARCWGFKTRSKHWDTDTQNGFNEHRERITDAIMDGRATINGSEITYTNEDGNTATFKRPCGRALSTMDAYKDQQSMHKMYAFLGFISGVPDKTLAKYEGIDTKFLTSLGSLFMAG